MALVSRCLRSITSGYVFWCPGCEEAHHITVGSPTHPNWDWDGNLDQPTFSPSILVRGVRKDIKKSQWKEPSSLEEYSCSERLLRDPAYRTICHSFIRGGMIEYLSDCTHLLAGQTIPLPDWPYSPGNYGGLIEDSLDSKENYEQ